MNSFFAKYISVLIIITSFLSPVTVYASNTSTESPISINATYSALIDGDTGRVLFSKNGEQSVPMASTTKIMTLIITLEYGKLDSVITVSKYAATMPDVQLNINSGEHYVLNDLLYSLMLNSHNDSAVAIAENVAYSYICSALYSGTYSPDKSPINLSDYDISFVTSTLDLSTISIEQSQILVSVFAALMNSKADELGCTGTYFITPNGLDASNDNGTHSTTAIDLARIMSYCIKNEQFLQITETASYSFCNKIVTESNEITNGNRSFSVTNANAFLNMMDGIISGKTGFTGNAGYCYVCALKRDDKTFICVVLACGWPPNKSYKWTDCKKILNWGLSTYYPQTIFTPISHLNSVPVHNGKSDSINTYVDSSITTLLSDTDNVNVLYNLPEIVEAPICSDDVIGTARIFINDELFAELPIQSSTSVERVSYYYYLQIVLNKLLLRHYTS